jgi:diphthamide synthase (EF-2-diphthine--ammonia ligase)
LSYEHGELLVLWQTLDREKVRYYCENGGYAVVSVSCSYNPLEEKWLSSSLKEKGVKNIEELDSDNLMAKVFRDNFV